MGDCNTNILYHTVGTVLSNAIKLFTLSCSRNRIGLETFDWKQNIRGRHILQIAVYLDTFSYSTSFPSFRTSLSWYLISFILFNSFTQKKYLLFKKVLSVWASKFSQHVKMPHYLLILQKIILLIVWSSVILRPH